MIRSWERIRYTAIFALILAAFALIPWISMQNQAFAAELTCSGSGTMADPYLIDDSDDLESVRQAVAAGDSFAGQFLRLEADIQLPAGWTGLGALKEGSTGTGSGANINPFSGILDGEGSDGTIHTVTAASGGQPLFAYVRQATIRNLNIAGTNINGSGLIGKYVIDRGTTGVGDALHTADVYNVTIKSGTTIKGSGIASGYTSAGNTINITSCTVEAGVTIGSGGTAEKVGSFGGDFTGTITDCTSAADVYGSNFVGGIMGCRNTSMSNTVISGCTFTGRVIASGYYAGGIAGGSYGGTGWGINTAPNAPGAVIQDCLCTGSVQAKNVAGGILGYDTTLQAWDNGRGSLQGNLFTGTVKTEVTGDDAIAGGLAGQFRGLDKYNNFKNNYFSESCGADRAVGGAGFVDTSCSSHETTAKWMTADSTTASTTYYDTSIVDGNGKPTDIPDALGTEAGTGTYASNIRANHNRTDDPLGADSDSVAKAVTAEQLAGTETVGTTGKTVTELLSAATGSGRWTQGTAAPALKPAADLSDSLLSMSLLAGYPAQYNVGDTLDPAQFSFCVFHSNGTAETVTGGEGTDKVSITGFSSTRAKTVILTAAYKTLQTQFTVDIIDSGSGGESGGGGSGGGGGDPAGDTITVSFTLLGDSSHPGDDSQVHTRAAGNLQTWMAKKSYTISAGSTAWNLIEKALDEGGLNWLGTSNTQYGSVYISAVQIPGSSAYLKEKENGPNAGWMYAVNGEEPGVGVSLTILEDGDDVILFYTDDYTKESSADPFNGDETVRQKLKKLLSEAGALNAGDYTEESYQVLQAALTAAEKIAADLTASDEQIQAALDALTQAVQNLVRAGSDEPSPAVAEGSTYVVDGNYYLVTGLAGVGEADAPGTVSLVQSANTGSVTIPAAVVLADGRTYLVTAVEAKAFTGSEIRRVILGASLKTLKAGAFTGSSAVKLIVKSRKLTKASVRGSLKGSKIRVVRVKAGGKVRNRKYVKKYRKIFTEKNAGKKVKVK